MKKLIATLTLCSLPLFGFAGPHCPSDGKAMDSAIEQLQLSTDQKAKVKALQEKHQAEMKTQHDAMKAMRDKHHDELKAILGDEKFKKFEELMHSQHDKMGHGDHHGMMESGEHSGGKME